MHLRLHCTLNVELQTVHHRFELVPLDFTQPHVEIVAHDDRVKDVRNDEGPDVVAVLVATEHLGNEQGRPKDQAEDASQRQQTDEVAGFRRGLVG